jgi:hypothetical protein
MSAEEFRNLTQGIQAIFISIGAIIASGWAIYTFRSLLSVQKAKAELEKLNTEISKGKAELVLIQQEQNETPILEIEIEPFLLGTTQDNNLNIRIKLYLKNTGNTIEYIDWRKSNIKAAILEEVIDHKLQHSDPITGVLGRIDVKANGELLRPNETYRDEVLIPIEQHGIYIIYAAIYVAKKSTEVLASEMPSPGASISFGTSIFFDSGSCEPIVAKKNA